MTIIVTFLLGILNFALYAAVLDSGHRLLRQIPGVFRAMGGRLTLLMEFVVLLAVMLLVANGWTGAAWAYAGYSAFNAVSAWLILGGRI